MLSEDANALTTAPDSPNTVITFKNNNLGSRMDLEIKSGCRDA